MTATEHQTVGTLRQRGFGPRIDALGARGVEILDRVDAGAIHEKFKGRKFTRIQWNGPDLGTPAFQAGPSALAEKLHDFFRSASHLQEPGDRIHLTLLAPPDTGNPEEKNWKHYQAFKYRLHEFLRHTDYDLYKVKISGESRYQMEEGDGHAKYVHQKTKGAQKVAAAEHLMEYIFVKLKPQEAPLYPELLKTIHGDLIESGYGASAITTKVEGQYVDIEPFMPLENLSSDEDED